MFIYFLSLFSKHTKKGDKRKILYLNFHKGRKMEEKIVFLPRRINSFAKNDEYSIDFEFAFSLNYIAVNLHCCFSKYQIDVTLRLNISSE